MIRIFDLDTQPGHGRSGISWLDRSALVSRQAISSPLTLSTRRPSNIFDIGTQRWSGLPPKLRMSYPEWSTDSRFIYFRHGPADDPGVYRMRVKGGESEKVVDLKNWPVAGPAGRDGTRSYRCAVVAPRYLKQRYLRSHPGGEVTLLESPSQAGQISRKRLLVKPFAPRNLMAPRPVSRATLATFRGFPSGRKPGCFSLSPREPRNQDRPRRFRIPSTRSQNLLKIGSFHFCVERRPS